MVNLPLFRKISTRPLHSSQDLAQLPNDGLNEPIQKPTHAQIKRATQTRKTFSLLSSFFLFVSVVFLILVEIGQTKKSAVLSDIYFLNLELQNIVPQSVPNARLLNSIARTIGLHDFYSVGLWGFCSGYANEGVTQCSEPKRLYWFDPVAIIRDELISGAVIRLPGNIEMILDIIRIASHWMFAFFLVGAVLSTALVFVLPLAVRSRWVSLPLSWLSAFNAAVITIACSIATALFVIFRNVVSSVEELNIGARVGIKMFTFMWIASGFAITAALIQAGMCCCCTSRRDVKKGKKGGEKINTDDKRRPGIRRRFGRKIT